jgi:D-ribose pyranase
MKKSVLINQPLSAVIAGMGHTDELVVADAGLPIPSTTERIDLALTANVPRFLETLAVVLSELQVESAVIAAEMISASPELHAQLLTLLGDIPVSMLPHEAFKQRTAGAKAVVRTGECTPYANVILVSGVVF